ncbi:MAG: hypothetical protein M3Y28_05225 [Armatimonadota bacterium]|nr:hypothetical protein [Armatimonadota bacterium]
MTQTIFVPQEDDHFEGIGPYVGQQFRLASAPETPPWGAPLPSPQEQMPVSRPTVPLETERLDQHADAEAFWCDVGICLIVLISASLALCRLIWLGQP